MSFEKLEVWQRSCRLSVAIYQELKGLHDFGFKDQITRSGLSIPSNISEGMERISNKEKLQFLNIARASCAELRTQLYIGGEINYIPTATAKLWVVEIKEISAMISGLIISIKKLPTENC